MTPQEAIRRSRLKRALATDAIRTIATGMSPTVSPAKLPCDYRGDKAGVLFCNCAAKPTVYACRSGQAEYCILEPLTTPWSGMLVDKDQVVHTADGHPVEFIPWADRPDMEDIGGIRRLPVCSLCQWRKQMTPDRRYRPRRQDFIGRDEMVYKTCADLLLDTMELLLPQVPSDVSAVVGIPRSGLAPAAAIATAMNLPLYLLSPSSELVNTGAGWRKDTLPAPGQRLLVVDDSTFSGTSMFDAREALAGYPAVYAAVYAADPLHVDLYAVRHEGPHLFQWNIWNNAALRGETHVPALSGGIATDLDGVLCEDPPTGDDTAGFLDWLPQARPLNLPRAYSVPLIVSFRIEAWREQTEAWLRRWGINWDRLVLHPAQSVAERDSMFDVAEHKGETYRQSACSLMFESSSRQAKVIAEVAGKPVINHNTGEVFR